MNSGANEWIQNSFLKRECIFIVPTSKDSNKCGCGRYLANHYYFENEYDKTNETTALRWSIAKCTGLFPTDAFGTLSFQGVRSINKSQYVRLDFGTEPQDVWNLLVDAWGFEPPKLIISVEGSATNFELHQTLTRALRKGLLNAAKTTNAWIITAGARAGAVKHAANALNENFSARKMKFTIIGILPWASMKRSDDLVNCGKTIPYYSQACPDKSRHATLCEGHNCFLLVDNGAVGRAGAELFFRKRFEDFLKQKPMGKNSRLMPMVNLVLGGGRQTIQTMLSNISGKPPLPIVVCNGSGRAADVIAMTYKLMQDEKDAEESYKPQIVRMIEESFSATEEEAKRIFKTIVLVVRKRNLINIFSHDEDGDHEAELDCVILNALLKDHNFSPVEQLSLLLTWNREDVAKEIFERGYEWPAGSLDMAMMQALANDRVGFVKLLLENGMAMDKFLTVSRLEDLYNTEHGPTNTLRFILQDVTMDTKGKQKYNLLNVGLIVDKLMGGGYRSSYSAKEFRYRYKMQLRRQTIVQKDSDDTIIRKGSQYKAAVHFNHPFNDLFIWAVLTKRHEMAMCMWEKGEEPLAKALVGFVLNKKLGNEAEDDYFKVEICEELRANAKAFKNLACELLEQCYQTDDDLTFQLLTYELKNWSKISNLSLTALANHKRLLAHPSCQMLMADLWLGGLRIRKKTNLKVFLSVIFPPAIFMLPFKTQEQLLYQPQTEEEYFENRPELNDEDNESSADSDSDYPGSKRMSLDIEGGELNNILDIHNKTSAISNAIGGRIRKISKSLPMSISSVGFAPKYDHQNNILKSMDTINSNKNFVAPSSSRKRTTARGTSICVLEPKELDELNRLAALSLENKIKGGNCNCKECHSAGCKCSVNKRRDRFRSVFSLGTLFEGSSEQNDAFSFQQTQHRLPIIKNHELTIKKKLQEFYQAPIACFWSFVIGYVFFLGTYTYTVLVKTEETIYWPEAYVIAFITTFSIDQVRRVLLQEPKSFDAKLNVYLRRFWDLLSCVFCLLFFVGLFLRVSDQETTRMYGRILYCCIIPFWYVRTLHLLTVSHQLGPYIFMFGKMVIKMCILATILFVILMSFGVVRQSILYPYESFQWSLLQQVVYRPYFMLYGELYADDIDDCGDHGTDCVPGFWLSIIFMTVYLLLSIIVFLNMMIAAFNHVFLELQSKTHLIWQMQRYDQVIEFEQQPFIPPPFIIFADIYFFFKYLYRKILKKDKVYRFEHSLRLYLSSNELDKLHDFELICLKELLVKKENTTPNSVEEQLKQMKEKIESLTAKIDDRYAQFTKDQLSLLLLNDKCIRVENNDLSQTPVKISPETSRPPSETAASVCGQDLAIHLNVPNSNVQKRSTTASGSDDMQVKGPSASDFNQRRPKSVRWAPVEENDDDDTSDYGAAERISNFEDELLQPSGNTP